MDILPYDCYLNICRFLDIGSILRLISINKDFYNFYKKNRKYIYADKLKEDYNYLADNAEEIYKKFYKMDFNGKYVVDNKIYYGDMVVVQTYMADVRCKNNEIEAIGEFEEENISFEMMGRKSIWELEGNIIFNMDNNFLGKTKFVGKVNVEKYLRSGVIEINATYEYKDDNMECNGTTKCQRLMCV